VWKFQGAWKDEGVRFISIKFQGLKLKYPPPPNFKGSNVSGVLIFTLKMYSLQDINGLEFKVICVSHHFQVFWFWWCVYISLMVHHLKEIKVWKFQGGWIDEWVKVGNEFIIYTYDTHTAFTRMQAIGNLTQKNPL